MRRSFRLKKRRGFSLLEMLLVMVLISVIAAVIIPRIGHHTLTTKREACHQYQSDINSMAERYYFDTNTIPSIEDLDGAPYFIDPIPKCPVNNQAYALDPATGRVVGHDH